MHENIRFAVMNEDVDPYTQLSGAVRELYGHRMNAYADLANAKSAELQAKLEKEKAIADIVQADEDYKALKNVQQRDGYLRQKLSYSFGIHQSYIHNLAYCHAAYELTRMSLSEIRLQIDLLKLFMGDMNEEGQERIRTDNGGGEEEIS